MISTNNNEVWDRLERRSHLFRQARDKRVNPEKYDLLPKYDFRPKILASSYSQGRCSINPKYVGDYLYKHAQMMQAKKQLLLELATKRQETKMIIGSQVKVGKKSKEIVDKKLRSKLDMIFSLLDS